jgi:hypothetical protein
MTPALSLVLACLLGAEVQLDAGVRTEVWKRWAEPNMDAGGTRTVDLTVSPHLALRVLGPAAELGLAYSPRLTVRELAGDQRFEQLHDGEGRLRLGRGAAWRVEALVGGAIGRTDLVTQNRLEVDPTHTITVSTTSPVDLRSLRSGLNLRLSLGARNELTASATAATSSGANERSRASLPLEQDLGAALEYQWRATHLDQFGLRVAGQGTRLPDLDVDSAWSTALATWRHRTSQSLEVWGGGGFALFYSSSPDGAVPGARVVSRAGRPAAGLGLTKSGLAEGLTFNLEARLGASSDRITGVAAQQLDGVAGLRWAVDRTLAVRGSGTASVAWPPGGTTRRGGVELGASRAVGSHVTLELGATATWQRSQGIAAAEPSFTLYGLFLALALAAPSQAW